MDAAPEHGGAVAARYERPAFPGASWLRTHPPLGARPRRAVLPWALALAAVEVLAAAVAEPMTVPLLVDGLLVPTGLVAGCWGLAVRRRRRRTAAAAAAPTGGTGAAWSAAEQWDQLIHAALLVNLVVFVVLLLASDAGALRLGEPAFGPVLVASALIVPSVLATWATAGTSTAEREALALAGGGPPARRVRWARRLVRVSLLPHVLLALAAIGGLLFI